MKLANLCFSLVLLLLLMTGCDQALDLIQSVADDEPANPGLLVVTLTVKDADKFDNDYFPRASETLQHAGATSLLKGVSPEFLHGNNDGQVLVAFRFPSQEAIHTWYHSPEYQTLIPTRLEAADMSFTSYELVDQNPDAGGDGILGVHILVEDPVKFDQYFAQAGPTVQAAGGQLQYKGANGRVLHGENYHPVFALFRFGNKEAVTNWYDSDTYQALIPLRLQAADMAFTAYETPPPSDTQPGSVQLQFDKSPISADTWVGTTWDGITGEIETVLTRAETAGSIMSVDLTFIVTDTAGAGMSFTAELSGTINMDTGVILLNGDVTDGWSPGAPVQVDAQVQDNDFSTFRVLGTIHVQP